MNELKVIESNVDNNRKLDDMFFIIILAVIILTDIIYIFRDFILNPNYEERNIYSLILRVFSLSTAIILLLWVIFYPMSLYNHSKLGRTIFTVLILFLLLSLFLRFCDYLAYTSRLLTKQSLRL